ncbi:Uncharacterised protein [Vibrio cholerae]|nr:Uncharacterised protein [Vibrio cholerae]
MHLSVLSNASPRVNGNIASTRYGIWITFHSLHSLIRTKDALLFSTDGAED